MLKPENDPVFRDKFRDFEPEHGDRWSQIEAALPKEKKRRGFLWLWIGLGLVAGGAAFFMLPSGDKELAQAIPSKPGPALKKTEQAKSAPLANPVEPKTAQKRVLVAIPQNVYRPKFYHPYTPDYSPKEALPAENNGNTGSDLKNENLLNQLINATEPPAEEGINSAKGSGNIIVASDSLSEPAENSPVAMTPPDGKNKKTDKKKEDGENKKLYKWSMGIGMGAYSSRFTPTMPTSVGQYSAVDENMVKNNLELRKQIEKPGYTFSQSLWLRYQPNERWSFRSGISMMQTTQILQFDIQKGADRVQSPGDFPESGNNGPGGVYLFPDDSILPGTGSGARNHYYSREIPLFVSYTIPLQGKWSLDLSAGATYRWVRSLSVYLPDVDNVGMVYMQGPEYYPGIKSTFHVQGGIGVNYAFNDLFTLQAMPTYQMALQSNMRFEHYVQQYQKQWGCQFVLTRRLGF